MANGNVVPDALIARLNDRDKDAVGDPLSDELFADIRQAADALAAQQKEIDAVRRAWDEEIAQGKAQAQRIAKQDEFKSYTHQRLNELGVPHTVVGGRFDWVAQRIEELESAREVQEAALSNLRNDFRECAIRAEKAEAALAERDKLLLRAVEALRDGGEYDFLCGQIDAALKEKP